MQQQSIDAHLLIYTLHKSLYIYVHCNKYGDLTYSEYVPALLESADPLSATVGEIECVVCNAVNPVER